MTRLRTTLSAFVITSVITAAFLTVAPVPAQATEPASPAVTDRSATTTQITPGMVDRAIAEARDAGFVRSEDTHADGTRTITIDSGDGRSLEFMKPAIAPELSTGSDGYGGWFVGFNTFDQNAILGGADAGLTAGICLGGPVLCAVATVAIVLASAAVGTSGIRCSGKSLRVYPISQKTPRCA